MELKVRIERDFDAGEGVRPLTLSPKLYFEFRIYVQLKRKYFLTFFCNFLMKGFL